VANVALSVTFPTLSAAAGTALRCDCGNITNVTAAGVLVVLVGLSDGTTVSVGPTDPMNTAACPGAGGASRRLAAAGGGLRALQGPTVVRVNVTLLTVQRSAGALAVALAAAAPSAFTNVNALPGGAAVNGVTGSSVQLPTPTVTASATVTATASSTGTPSVTVVAAGSVSGSALTNNAAAIIGGTIAAIFVVFLVAALVVFCVGNRKRVVGSGAGQGVGIPKP